MKILVAENEALTESQIDEIDAEPQSISGVLVLDDDERVVCYPSEWLTALTHLQDLTYKTAVTYARNISYFIDFLGSRPEFFGLDADQMLLRVNRSLLEDWVINQQEDVCLDRTTVRNREGCLRSFYTYLSDNERRNAVLEKSPFPSKYLSAKPHVKQVVSASLDELVSLMNECKHERERLLLQFMYDSGLRISEVERVTFGHIQNAIKFTNSGFVSSKAKNAPARPGYAPLLILGSKGRGNSIKERHAIVTLPTLKRISTYHSSPLYRRYQRRYQDKGQCPAFLNTVGDPYNEESLAKMIKRRSDSALRKKLISKKVHAHLFRHGSAYLTLQDPNLGGDFLDRLVNVQKTLGHSFISTTERYTSVPHDIYDSIADSNFGALKTKIEKMEAVVERTKLKIRPGDKK